MPVSENKVCAQRMKLLVLLGAGSSCGQLASDGAKFPLLSELNCEIKKWAETYATQGIDCYDQLWKLRSDYNIGYEWLEPVNFEQVLGDFNSLLNGLRRSPFGDPVLAKAAKAIGFPDDDGRWFGSAQGQLENLFTKLANQMRDTSRRFESLNKQCETTALSDCKKLFRGLSDEFDLGIYNLNYDTVALNAAPIPLFTGFDHESGRFRPDEVYTHRKWNFIYHLHGSVHYCFGEAPDDRIVWEKNLGNKFSNTKAILTEGADRRVRIASTIVAGGGKLDQLQDEPFQTIYGSFPRHAYEADAILIGGYGFGDQHINSVLTNILLNRRQKIPILLLEKSGPNTCPKLGESVSPRTTSSPWMRVQNTLRPTGLLNPGPKGVPEHPGFEYVDHASRPIAIWLNGFETANSEIGPILKWLKSGSF